MTQNAPLDIGDPAAEGFFDATQEMLSGAKLIGGKGFQLKAGDATTVQLPAGPGHDQVAASIQGQYRWITATLERTHPGGAAGTYDLCLTSQANSGDTGRPANGDSSFALAIVPTGQAPAGAAIYSVVRQLQWSGAAITRIDRLDVEGPARHAATHAANGTDPLPADSITATQIAPDAVGADELAADSVGTSELAPGAVTTTEVAAALKPSGGAAAGTEALRALGATAATAAAGNDARLSDQRVPQDASVTRAKFIGRAVGPDQLDTIMLDALGDTLQEGVVKTGDGALTRLDANNMRIAAGVAWIDGDGVGGLTGRYRVTWPQTDLNFPNAALGFNRLDEVIVRMPASGHGVGTIERVAGAEVAAQTIDARQGAAAVPNGCALLHDVRINEDKGNRADLGATQLRDRRRRARGFYRAFTSNTAGDATTASVNYINTNIAAERIEINPANSVRFRVTGHAGSDTAGRRAIIGLLLDGGELTRANVPSGLANGFYPFVAEVVRVPNSLPAGTGLFTIGLAMADGGVARLVNSGTVGVNVEIEEIITSNSNNGTA